MTNCRICGKERGTIKSSQNICSYCVGIITKNSRKNVCVEEVMTMLKTGCASNDTHIIKEISDEDNIEVAIECRSHTETGYDIAKRLYMNYMNNVWDQRFEDLMDKAEKEEAEQKNG